MTKEIRLGRSATSSWRWRDRMGDGDRGITVTILCLDCLGSWYRRFFSLGLLFLSGLARLGLRGRRGGKYLGRYSFEY